jgi:hypothetical protein
MGNALRAAAEDFGVWRGRLSAIESSDDHRNRKASWTESRPASRPPVIAKDTRRKSA